MGAGIRYLDGRRLRRSLLAAADWVHAGRAELNRINVFPVPDGDTGTNFSLTMRAVAEAVAPLGRGATLGATARTAATAGVMGARGNSGMLFSHFLLGFAEPLAHCARATAQDIAKALRRGADRLQQALEEPVEGTILTVCREVAAHAERIARSHRDLGTFMRETLQSGLEALERTPQLLATLREAGVVDAGAKAFVNVLEAVVRLIDGAPLSSDVAAAAGARVPAPAAAAAVEASHDYRFCTEVLIRGPELPDGRAARAALRPFGDSIVVVAADDILKAHVHTDEPDKVFALARSWGTLEWTKAEDMREQHRRLGATPARLALVADTSHDLPAAIVAEIGLVEVPLQIAFGDEVFLDRVDVTSEVLYRRLRAGESATTSQPTPAAFTQAFQLARERGEEVLAVLLARVLSGTFASAEAAARQGPQPRPVLVDSAAASLGVGLLLLRAAELADQEWSAAAVAGELNRIRRQSGMFCTVDRLDFLVRSGRVSGLRGWLGGLLDLKPILGLSPEGRVEAVGKARGRDGVLARVLELLDEALTPRPTALRLGIVHADCPDVAARLAAELERRYQPKQVVVAPVTGVIAAHTGPDAWGVFYQVEDAAGGNYRGGGRL